MSKFLIRNVLHQGILSDILIVDNHFSRIVSANTELAAEPADTIWDLQGKQAILPAFYNTHNHAAMTIFRSYADDLELFNWLSNYIWPIEAKLNAEDVYAGTRLAILEMIRSGTVFFNDMYWFAPATLRAVESMKMRSCLGLMILDGDDGRNRPQNETINAELLSCFRDAASPRLQLSVAPHAIYTVGEASLRRAQDMANTFSAKLHIHLAETQTEFDNCRKAHHNMTPVEYLDSLGLVHENLVAAHCVALSDSDIALLSEKRAVLSHMPCSNMKLGSGQFRFAAASAAQCRITIGTDGCASNNNLSMLDEMKFAALSAKNESSQITAASAREIFDVATRGGAEAFDLNAGVIAEGKLADAIFVDLDNTRLLGGDLIANMVYSADSSCIRSVICDGNILMQEQVIPGEAEIIHDFKRTLKRLEIL